jgi:hypothetical protein
MEQTYKQSKVLNRSGLKSVLLFIAELNSFKSGSITAKIKYGVKCYLSTTLHDLDYDNEDDRADAHENIWLERIYDSLDAHFQLDCLGQLAKEKLSQGNRSFAKRVFGNPSTTYQWDVPLEADASALTISAH